MRIEIKTEPGIKEPHLVIITDRITEEIESIVKRLSDESFDMITGYKDDMTELIEIKDIIRIYSSGKKIVMSSEKGVYALRQRLYELEEKLCGSRFVRISNSEIINLKKVKNFDLKITGTICVRLLNGETTYVSRRYVSKIKRILGM